MIGVRVPPLEDPLLIVVISRCIVALIDCRLWIFTYGPGTR
jgi:hypothetical protein